jgi:hypothetical protein
MGDQQLSLLEVRNRMRNQVDDALRMVFVKIVDVRLLLNV